MKRIILSFLALFMVASFTTVFSQKKIDGKLLKEVKEWSVSGDKKKLDHITKYNEKGKKVEEIEYNSVGDQKSRVTYKYNDADKCIEEQHFDEFDKLEKTLQFEYNESGKKSLQRTILPNGKLKNTKEFEYILQ